MSVALSNPPTPAFDPADKTASAEADWLRRCRQGDLAAWRELYDQQFERVYRLVQRLGVPERDAADVCQEVFLRVHRGLGRFRGDAQIGTWLFRIALNESRRWGRLRGVRQALLALYSREPIPAPGLPDEALARAEGWRELGALLGQLKPKLREAFVLFEIEELSLEQVSAVLDVGTETVKSRIKRARAEFERLRRQRTLLAVAGGAGGRP
jgi:RNA polymerase sigma-70 factor (ECF subfamily)